ncbi:MAG: efflux RND transporter permease subunit [Alphaproteobacteria bacterium]|nr:efflux RND transporter permease subunit [Alphaproteobacteria bacterium]
MARLIIEIKDVFGKAEIEAETFSPLLLGDYVDVIIKGNEVKNVFVIPRSVLKDGDYIYVINFENRLEIIKPEIVWKGAKEIYIRGINNNTEVISSDIANKISSSSVEIPGGGIKTESGEILVRVKQRRDYGREFAEIPIISNSDGTYLLLGDIATIKDGYEDNDSYATYNGKRSAMIDVYAC